MTFNCVELGDLKKRRKTEQYERFNQQERERAANQINRTNMS